MKQRFERATLNKDARSHSVLRYYIRKYVILRTKRCIVQDIAHALWSRLPAIQRIEFSRADEQMIDILRRRADVMARQSEQPWSSVATIKRMLREEQTVLHQQRIASELREKYGSGEEKSKIFVLLSSRD